MNCLSVFCLPSIFGLLLLGFACSEPRSVQPPAGVTTSDLIGVQVDFQTGVVEGGAYYANIVLPNAPDSLPIGLKSYTPAGDFGNIQWEWKPSQELLFNGDIVWMGLGTRIVPEFLTAPEDLGWKATAAAAPDSAQQQWLAQKWNENLPIDVATLWSEVLHLPCFHNRREGLPIAIYLYTPSVGIGDPATWKYWIWIPQNPLLQTQAN